MVASVLGMTGCVTPPTPDEMAKIDYGSYPSDYENIINRYLRQVLKDPDSAKVEFLNRPTAQFHKKGPLFGGGINAGYGVCAYVNAKNSYGGYTGAKLHWFLIKNGRVTDDSNGMQMMAQNACRSINAY